jgi:hypothetical protein
MEIPAETSLEALRLAKAHGVFSILNPAPAPEGGLSQVRAISTKFTAGNVMRVWAISSGEFLRRPVSSVMSSEKVWEGREGPS